MPPTPATRLADRLPDWTTDAALLAARLLIGTIMIAHGYQKLMVQGLGQTTDGFERLSIPLAIVSAAFVTVVESVGGVLLLVGLLARVSATLFGVVMIGAAVFVHGSHGVFVKDGGWELVGAIGAALLALAAIGPGRFALGPLIARYAGGPGSDPAAAAAPAPEVALPAVVPVPPPGLPAFPMVRPDADVPVFGEYAFGDGATGHGATGRFGARPGGTGWPAAAAARPAPRPAPFPQRPPVARPAE